MKFENAVEEYVNAKIGGRKPIRPNTLEGYMSAIRCHPMPKWTGREMEEIKADELQDWVDGFEKPGAARKAFGTFRQIMRWYLREYHVRIYDETQAVELPTKPRRKPNALTMKQGREYRIYRPEVACVSRCKRNTDAGFREVAIRIQELGDIHCNCKRKRLRAHAYQDWRHCLRGDTRRADHVLAWHDDRHRQ